MKVSARKIGKILILPILLALIIIFLHACMPSFRMSGKEIDRYFKEHKISGSQHVYKSGFRDVHYVMAGNNGGAAVLFVHGSPGSLSAFIHFLSDTILANRALLVSADRPGFGYSNFGLAEPSLEKQAETLKPILEKYKNNRPMVLVGHSLGGPLIARMAADYPDLVDGLVIVAGSVDPQLEPNETWFRAPLATPFLSWVLPGSFRASNEEIYHLKPELQKMLPLWKEITCRVIVIQGMSDELVPAANADFAERMLTGAQVEVVRVDGMNHFVPWSNPELIHDAILKIINELKITGIVQD